MSVRSTLASRADADDVGQELRVLDRRSRLARPRHLKCGIAMRVVRSRQVRVAGVARTVRGCLVRVPSARRVFRRRRASIADETPPRPAITIEFASPARRQVLSLVRHGLQAFPSLCWVARKGRGQNPRAFNQIGTRPPGRWGNARRSTAPAPQSKPVTPASRLVAQVAPSVASGLGPRILAAGPARSRLYSDCRRYVDQAGKFLGLVRGREYRPIGPAAAGPVCHETGQLEWPRGEGTAEVERRSSHRGPRALRRA